MDARHERAWERGRKVDIEMIVGRGPDGRVRVHGHEGGVVIEFQSEHADGDLSIPPDGANASRNNPARTSHRNERTAYEHGQK
ncbi:hypothetical protein D7B24_007677, partial [Verticillium nonalfalfae]